MIYTIGHSNHNIDTFIKLLKKFNIDCICDIRSTPYSKYAEQFNREDLTEELKKNGIVYLYFGDEFGARRKEKSLFSENYVDFEKVANSEIFLKGVERIKKGVANNYKIALMCTEKEPIECHRSILVSRNLNSVGIKVRHILEDSTTITQEQIEDELIFKFFGNINQLNFIFDNDKDYYLSEAYKKANIEVGFRKEDEE